MTEKQFGFFVEEEFLNNVNFYLVSVNESVALYKMQLSFDIPKKLTNFKVCFYRPMLGSLSVWHSLARRNRAARQWFEKNGLTSSFYAGAPIICAVNGEKNYSTLALSDGDTPITLNFFVDDFADNDEVCFETIFFANTEKEIKEYSVFFRIDDRECPYYKCINEVGLWWSSLYGRVIQNNSFAEDALYSSWYNFHQHPNAEKLREELTIASRMGFKTVILDDGWQYDGNGTGDYFDCGDWKFSEEKFPKPNEFIDFVHTLGMKVLVWFPVPFVGYNTKKYVEFKDKLLYNDEFSRAGVLDPRCFEVRKFLLNLYKDFVTKYKLDGLKLDFIDNFLSTSSIPPFNPISMDFENVEDAVNKLLVDIIDMLKEVLGEPLFEFRQGYVGPSIVKYCNMLRVADCAFDAVTNRVGIVDLRLLNYDLAVHSDMLYWSPKESPVFVKKQLLNVLFSVPQISVLLSNSTEEQLKVLKNHIEYYNANRELLLHGEIQPLSQDQTYPCVSAVLGDKTVTVLHNSLFCKYTGGIHDIFNISETQNLAVISKYDCVATVFGVFGEKIYEINLQKGINLLNVSIGGMVTIRK